MAQRSKNGRKAVSKRAGVPAGERAVRRNAVVTKPDLPTTRRGNLTRDNIKKAAVRVLERVGYRAMRLADIAQEAEVNVSLLYHYFAGKSELTHEILAEFLADRPPPGAAEGKDPFDVIVEANRVLVNAFANSPGLMRCLLHFDEEEPEFSELYRNLTTDWSNRIARDIARRCPNAPLSENQRLMIAYALGGMVDKFLFEVYVDRTPVFADLAPNTEEVAVFLAILWYRAIYLANPPKDKMAGYEGFLKLDLPVASGPERSM